MAAPDGDDLRKLKECVRAFDESAGHLLKSMRELLMAGRCLFDVAIECAGNADAVPEGFKLLRDGGTYVIAGHYTDVGSISINPHIDINRKHADVRGRWGLDYGHLYRSLRLLARNHEKLPFARVIGGRYSLEDAGRALSDVAALKVTKAIIVPAGAARPAE